MTVLARMITSHTGWDCLAPPGRGGGRHSEEIANLWAAYANCGALWYGKNCPGFPPTLDPYPEKKCERWNICEDGQCKPVLVAVGATAAACAVGYGVYKVVRTCAAGAVAGPAGACVSLALP